MNATDLRRSAHNHPMQRVRIIFVSLVPMYLRHYNTCAVQYAYIYIYTHTDTEKHDAFLVYTRAKMREYL